MKILMSILFIFLVSCGRSRLENENGVVFDSDKITGKYEIGLLDILRDNIEGDSSINEAGQAILYGLASFVTYSVSFYENQKGIASSNFSSKPVPFEYKIESDSILFIKDSLEFKQLGVIRKFSDNFDFIEIKTTLNKENNMILHLKRISK